MAPSSRPSRELTFQEHENAQLLSIRSVESQGAQVDVEMNVDGINDPQSQAEASQNMTELPSNGQLSAVRDESLDFVSEALPYWCAWPNVRRPLYLVRTNRDVVPEIPPETIGEPQRCVNGRRGLLEASRLPQKHQDDWHLAFIPMAKPRHNEVPFQLGRPWWHLEYTDPSEDLAWYRLQDEHLQLVGNQLFKPYWQLRNRIEVAQIEASIAWDMSLRKANEWLPRFRAPYPAHARFVELSEALVRQSLTEWDLRAHFADWQRYLNELRGWFSFVDATVNTEWASGQPELEPAAAAKRAKSYVATRHVAPYRGIFTSDEKVAMLCAAYDVPVWLLIPFRPALLVELRDKQKNRVLRRAQYRKYGTTYCAYVHGIERSYHEKPLPVTDIGKLGRSTKAYSDAHWNAEDINPLEDGEAPATNDSTAERAAKSRDPRLHPAGPAAAHFPTAPAPPGPQRTTASTSKSRATASSTPSSSTSSSVLSAQPGKRGKKRKANELDDGNSGKPKAQKKRGIVAQLLDKHGSSLKPAEVGVSGPEVSPFNTAERPHWFPSPLLAAHNVVHHRVDVGPSRQIALVASADLPIPTHLVGKGRLHKIPLLSYFLNAWEASRKEDFNKRKGKGGVVIADAAVPDKQPGHNITLGIFNWLKFRQYYLLKLKSSDASEILGLSAPDWRRVLKTVMPAKYTAIVVALLGLEASLPQAEPRWLAAPEPERDDPDDDDPEGDNGPVLADAHPPAGEPSTPRPSSLRLSSPRLSSPVAVPPSSSPTVPMSSQSLEYMDDDGLTTSSEDEIAQPEYALASPSADDLFDIPVAGDVPLRTTDQRSLAEPEDWYIKNAAKRQTQPLSKYTYYYPSRDEAGLVMLVISRSNPYFKYVSERSVEWWDYTHDSIYLLPRWTASYSGEQLLKPLRYTSIGHRSYAYRRRVWLADWDGAWERQGLSQPVSRAKRKTPLTAFGDAGTTSVSPSSSSLRPAHPSPVPAPPPPPAALPPRPSAHLPPPPASLPPRPSAHLPPPPASLPPRPSAHLPPHLVSEPAPGPSHLPARAPSPKMISIPASAPSTSSESVSDLPTDVAGYLDRISHPTFDGHELPPWIRTEDAVWPTLPWRLYILWEMGELEFRFELFFLDLTIRQAYPDHAPLQMNAAERYRQCRDCWGGSDFVPGVDPASNNKLCDRDPAQRLGALCAFYTFMRPWPRATDFLGPWEKLVASGGQFGDVDPHSNLFYELETSVWHCYGQIYFDYRHRLPAVPNIRPEMPV